MIFPAGFDHRAIPNEIITHFQGRHGIANFVAKDY